MKILEIAGIIITVILLFGYLGIRNSMDIKARSNVAFFLRRLQTIYDLTVEKAHKKGQKVDRDKLVARLTTPTMRSEFQSIIRIIDHLPDREVSWYCGYVEENAFLVETLSLLKRLHNDYLLGIELDETTDIFVKDLRDIIYQRLPIKK
ncbi:MAG: hypothetical protein WCJ45_06400 [bacterium]